MILKDLREQNKMSQKDLATKSGVAQSTIHYIETKQKSPTTTTLNKLAKALGVPITTLLEESA